MTGSGVHKRWLLATAAAVALSGCATGPDSNPRDPLEPFNREVTKINEDLDRGVFRPVAEVYSDVVPSPVRTAVTNVFSNFSDVYSALNNLLQGKPKRFAEDTMRVAINTVLGLGGLIDIATPAGLPKYNEDFGQTLGVWGVPSGPYLVLPLFGPSTVRDTTGMFVDRQADPGAYIYPVSLRNSLTGVRLVNTRANLLGATSLIEQAALDKYAFTRDAYLQRRAYLINDGNLPDEDDEDDDASGDTGSEKDSGQTGGQAGDASGKVESGAQGTEPAPASPTQPAIDPSQQPMPVPSLGPSPGGGLRLGR